MTHEVDAIRLREQHDERGVVPEAHRVRVGVDDLAVRAAGRVRREARRARNGQREPSSSSGGRADAMSCVPRVTNAFVARSRPRERLAAYDSMRSRTLSPAATGPGATVISGRRAAS